MELAWRDQCAHVWTAPPFVEHPALQGVPFRSPFNKPVTTALHATIDRFKLLRLEAPHAEGTEVAAAQAVVDSHLLVGCPGLCPTHAVCRQNGRAAGRKDTGGKQGDRNRHALDKHCHRFFSRLPINHALLHQNDSSEADSMSLGAPFSVTGSTAGGLEVGHIASISFPQTPTAIEVAASA